MFLLIYIIVFIINIQFIKSQCLNPNQNYGYCVSIYECPSLLSVVKKQPLTDFDKRFLAQSQCNDGYGQPPLVCCNYDIRFDSNHEPPIFSNFNNRRNSFSFFPNQPSPRNNLNNKKNRNQNENLLPSPPSCGADSIGNRILSGTNTQLDEFPWLVLLEYRKINGDKGMNCGGTLINNRYVLTAAHCVTGTVIRTVGELKSVRLGEYDTTKRIDCLNNECSDPIVQINIDEIIPHEGFQDGSINRHHDIALIRLSQPVQYTNYIRPICLPFVTNSVPPTPGSNIIVAGWGRTLTSRRSSIKQKLTIPVTNQYECQQKFLTRNVNIIDSQICAGGEYREDSCDGDSGGPLMRYYQNSWVLEGVVSFGIRCGYKDWPAVHTRVASYAKWIQSKIRL